jgi:MFS superfamily sulfate permease-like transporter|tara:strand:- start:209 stop:460 length:252 start_codon:yes stop_codon:yes gene_type:complete
MEIGDLYSFVLTLVLIGMILGVGILVLGKFSITTGITDKASQGINDTIDAITPIASTWLPLIVTVVVLAIILTLVIRSFAGRR